MLSGNERNKPRLYVGHYLRLGGQVMPGGEDRFHWALLVTAKNERRRPDGHRFHARDGSRPGAAAAAWQYVEEATGRGPDRLQVLTRTRIAKVKDLAVLRETLRNVPVRAGDVPGWNCVAWVREALERLSSQDSRALGTAVLDWETVRDAAMRYTEQKIAEHRFDGQGASREKGVPTYDLLTGKEVSP